MPDEFRPAEIEVDEHTEVIRSTEWGVSWPGSIVGEKACDSEEAARQVVHLYSGTLISRPVTVIRGPWRSVDEADEIAASEASDDGYGWAHRNTDDRGH